MFTVSDITSLRKSPFKIIQANYHDVMFNSERTGHDWIIISYYDSSKCFILHRHSRRYPFHRQKGNYRSFKEALDYITEHEEWFETNKGR